MNIMSLIIFLTKVKEGEKICRLWINER